MQNDILANAIYVLSNNRIIDESCLSIDLRGQLAAQLYFRLRSSSAENSSRPDALIDLAFANHRRIFAGRERLGAGSLRSSGLRLRVLVFVFLLRAGWVLILQATRRGYSGNARQPETHGNAQSDDGAREAMLHSFPPDLPRSLSSATATASRS